MTCKVIHNALVNKVQTQAICNCRITAQVVGWSTSYISNVSIFLLTALGGLSENPVPLAENSKFAGLFLFLLG